MQYLVKMFRMVWRAKNVFVKSIRSGIMRFFESAQKEVNSKLLLVFPLPSLPFSRSFITFLLVLFE